MPFSIKQENVTQMIHHFFPEYKKHYGKEVDLKLELSIHPADEYFVRLDTKKGIVFGNKQNTVVQLRTYASNSTVDRELASEFDMFVEMDLNATLQNFIVYANFTSFSVNHVNMTINNCKLLKTRNY